MKPNILASSAFLATLMVGVALSGCACPPSTSSADGGQAHMTAAHSFAPARTGWPTRTAAPVHHTSPAHDSASPPHKGAHTHSQTAAHSAAPAHHGSVNMPAPQLPRHAVQTSPEFKPAAFRPPQMSPAPAPQRGYPPLPIGPYGEPVAPTGHPTPDGPGRGNLSQVSFLAEGACFDPTVDYRGRRIAFASTMHQANANIYIKNIGGSTITQVTQDPADDVMPTFSPTGDRIAFASNRAGKWDIYITSVEGSPPVQVTNDNDHEIHPSWSPDGRYIAYCKLNSQSGRWEVWVVDVETPGVRRFLEYGMFPKWSPDVASSKLLFQRPRERGSRLHGIWTVDYVSGEAINPTEIISAANAAAINPSWSPDGQRIVFVTVLDPESSPPNRPHFSDLWIVNVDGGSRLRLTDGAFANYQPTWAGDGYIYFISNRSGTDNIWAVATDRILDLTSSPSGIAGVPTDR